VLVLAYDYDIVEASADVVDVDAKEAKSWARAKPTAMIWIWVQDF